jgi:hypothetical protein
MSSFKKLSKPDVSVVPYYANKQWTLASSGDPVLSGYFTIYKGTNLTGSFSSGSDPKSIGQYERLIYTQINHMFYQSYTGSLNTSSLASSIYYESASRHRPTASYFIYNDKDDLIKSFPTGVNEGIRVISIDQTIYGNKVLPNTFQVSSSKYNIQDDGLGNLYDYSGSTTHVGNIFYAHGLAIITNQDYQSMFPLSSFNLFSVAVSSNPVDNCMVGPTTGFTVRSSNNAINLDFAALDPGVTLYKMPENILLTGYYYVIGDSTRYNLDPITAVLGAGSCE